MLALAVLGESLVFQSKIFCDSGSMIVILCLCVEGTISEERCSCSCQSAISSEIIMCLH